MDSRIWYLLALILVVREIKNSHGQGSPTTDVVSTDDDTLYYIQPVKGYLDECRAANYTKKECANKKCKGKNSDKCQNKGNKCCFVENCDDFICIGMDKVYGNQMVLTKTSGSDVL